MGDSVKIGPILLWIEKYTKGLHMIVDLDNVCKDFGKRLGKTSIEKYDEIAAHIQAIDRLLVKIESED